MTYNSVRIIVFVSNIIVVFTYRTSPYACQCTQIKRTLYSPAEAAYEFALFIRKPIPRFLDQAHARAIVRNFIEQLSAIFEVAPSRILRWSFVQNVLAACWGIRDALK
jgi:hypothetical protein